MRSYQLNVRRTGRATWPTFHATRTPLAYIVKSVLENTFSYRSYGTMLWLATRTTHVFTWPQIIGLLKIDRDQGRVSKCDHQPLNRPCMIGQRYLGRMAQRHGHALMQPLVVPLTKPPCRRCTALTTRAHERKRRVRSRPRYNMAHVCA